LEDDPSLFVGWTEHADKTKMINRKNMDAERSGMSRGSCLYACSVPKKLFEIAKIVLGYLTLAEHCGYRRDATMCNILFLDGYAVIPRAQWEIASFPLHEFFKIVKENSKSMA
jgi:hypothetical protein